MVPDKGIELIKGEKLILDTSSALGSSERVSITYTSLWQEVEIGTHILVDDGLIDLESLILSRENLRREFAMAEY
jgi:pyruvate kinase